MTVLGALSPTPTVVTDIAIYPIVGLIPPPNASWTLAADSEVEAVIEASLGGLAATHRKQTFERLERRTGHHRRLHGRRGHGLGRDGANRHRPADPAGGRPGTATGVAGAARDPPPAIRRTIPYEPFSIGTSTRLPHSVHEPS